MDWQLAEAKNKFSQVVNLALSEGPQRIVRRNQAVVLISEEEYKKLRGEKMDFITYLCTGPSFEGLDLTRDKSPMRDIEL